MGLWYLTDTSSFDLCTVSLDEQIFANGQSYVTMSHAKSWQNLEIWSFNEDAIKVDNEMLQELNRLKQKFESCLQIIILTI